MKRSEVLDRLTEMLEEQRKDLNNGSDYQDAESILYLLENDFKMKPFLREDIDYIGHDIKLSSQIWDWEPEDA